MKFRSYSIRFHFGAGLLAALLCLLPPTTIAADEDIIGSVTRHWSQRQASITTCCVRYTGTVLHPAKSMQHEPRIGKGLFPDKDVVGEIDMECILDFARGRFRANCLRDNWMEDEFVRERMMYLFDGEHLVRHIPKDDPVNSFHFQPGRKSAEVAELRKDGTKLVFFDRDRPIFLACGRLPIPFQNISPFNAADWRGAPVVLQGMGTVGEHECSVLRWTRDPGRPSQYVELWIDNKNPLVVPRYREIYNGVVNNEVVIDYEGGSDVPTGWVQRQFGTPGNRDGLLREYRVKVDRFEINCEPEDAVFSAPSKAGMVVRKGRDYYRVAQDGASLVPYTDTPTPRRKWAWYLMAAVVTLAGLAVVYRYFRRKAARRGESPALGSG